MKKLFVGVVALASMMFIATSCHSPKSDAEDTLSAMKEFTTVADSAAADQKLSAEEITSLTDAYKTMAEPAMRYENDTTKKEEYKTAMQVLLKDKENAKVEENLMNAMFKVAFCQGADKFSEALKKAE